jgi:2-polyprenyl-3-methyl-5-hydroxy-6-metoxy-1,4-benzoquinol methylase
MRVFSFLKRLRHAPGRTDALEHRVDFLNAENIRLNQVIRELIAANKLARFEDTSPSFDWQWGSLPAGEAMPTNPAFLARIPDRLLEMTGQPREWFAGKSVLDAGCGSGRWSYGLSKLGANVLSIDQSEHGLEATRTLCRSFPQHRTQKVNLLSLDLPEQFDFVWCYGVCHHTRDMISALLNVIARVKPGGSLFVMLYGYPIEVGDFKTHAMYEAWRQRLMPLSFEERVAAIREGLPEEDAHGWFDAVSPTINELVTWEWLQAFLQNHGFHDVRRPWPHGNHHVMADRAS